MAGDGSIRHRREGAPIYIAGEHKVDASGALADRFKLVIHKDTKPMSVFVLTMGKGKPKMKESECSGSPGCQAQPQNPEPGVVPPQAAACHNFTAEMMAQAQRSRSIGSQRRHITPGSREQAARTETGDAKTNDTGVDCRSGRGETYRQLKSGVTFHRIGPPASMRQ